MNFQTKRVLIFNDLVKKSKNDLLGLQKTLEAELFELNLKKVTSGMEKPHLKTLIKKNYARLMSAINEKKSE